jgi:cell division protein FtsW (lipid II flippase)
LSNAWQAGDSPQAAAKRTVREGRAFALTLAIGFLVWALLAIRKEWNRAAVITFVFSAVFLLAGLLVPGRLRPLRRGWMKLGEVIGNVTTPVLMAIVYYLVMTPAGILRRFRGRPHATRTSAWHRRAPLPPARRMERQF